MCRDSSKPQFREGWVSEGFVHAAGESYFLDVYDYVLTVNV